MRIAVSKDVKTKGQNAIYLVVKPFGGFFALGPFLCQNGGQDWEEE